MEEKITISLKEYKELLVAYTRVCIFADFVNDSKYSIDRKDCGRFLEFEVVKRED